MKKEKQDVKDKPEIKENRDIVLRTLRKSRKAYLVEYGCGIFLLSLLLISYFNNMGLERNIQYFISGLALFAFVSAEFSRIFVYYRISSKKITIVKGLIKQNRKNIYFHPLGFVPDINVKQSRMQRLLNYGTIFVQGSGGDNSFEVKDIGRPQKVMGLIEELIEKNKHHERSKKR